MGDGLHRQCHCGGVAFPIPSQSPGVVACRREDWRKMHGNCNAMLAAPRDAVRFEAGATRQWYASSDRARRGFFAVCGARLFKDNLGSDRLMVSAGVIDGATAKRIIRNPWEPSKGDRHDLPVLG